jgi:hypothetical protein
MEPPFTGSFLRKKCTDRIRLSMLASLDNYLKINGF